MVTLLFGVFLLVILYLRCTRTHKLYSYPRGALTVCVAALALLATPAPVMSTVEAVHHGRQMQDAFVPDRVRSDLQDPPRSLAPHADHATDHDGHPVVETHDPVRDRRSAMTQRWVGIGDAGAVCGDVESLVKSMTHADVERMSLHASVRGEEAEACHLRSRLAPYVWTDATVELQTSLASTEFSQVMIVSINVLAPTSEKNEIPPR